jgi:hypothetical protein
LFFWCEGDNDYAVTFTFDFACSIHILVLISAQAVAFLVKAHERLG